MHLFLLFCLSIVGSVANASSTDTESDIRNELETVTLQLKWFHQFQFAGYYAAKEKGFYKEVGLDVNFIERSPDINVVKQVVSGVAQYGIEDTGILVPYANGEPIRAFAAIFQHNPFIFASKQSSGIVSPYEMLGKRIMFDSVDGVGADEVPLRALFAETGITNAQYTHVKPSFNYTDLVQGKVDVMSGYITDLPYYFEQQGIKINIINPLNYGIDFYGDLLFTSEQELQQHPGRVQRFRKASLKGWQYALDHSEEVIQLIHTKYHSKQDIELLRYEAKQVKKLILPDTIPLGEIKAARLKQVANILVQLRLAPRLSEKAIDDFIKIQPISIKLTAEERVWLQQHIKFSFTGLRQKLPYESFDNNDHYIGIVSEYLKLIEKRLGITVNKTSSDSRTELIELVRQGKVDIISDGIDSDFKDEMLYTHTFHSSPFVIIMHKDEPFIENISHISDRKIALLKGHAYVNKIINKYPELKIHWVNTIEEGLSAVTTNEVDVFISCLTRSIYEISNLGLNNLRIVGKTEFKHQLAFGIQKELAPLVPLFNRALDSLTEVEERKIVNIWGEDKYVVKIDYQLIFGISAALLFVIAIISFWNRQLKKEIRQRKKIEKSLRQSEERFRTIFNEMPLGLARVDSITGKIYEVNPCYEQIVDRTQEALLLLDWMSITHPDDVQKDLDNMVLMNSGETTGFNMNKRLLRPDSSVVWINMTIASLQVEDNTKPRHLCIMEDISKRKIIDDQLRLAETVYQNTTQAIMVTDIDNLIVAVNPAFSNLTGYTLEEVVDKTPAILKSGRTSKEFYSKMWHGINETGQWHGEIWNKKKNGDEYAEQLMVNTVYADDQQVFQRVGLFSDITEKKLAEEKIWKQANFDALTNLPNRNMFADRLKHDIKISHRSTKPLALLFLDLDHFKEVNDALGHDKGDLLLIEAAKRINECVRESDTVSRLGGDEFTVILTELDDTLHIERIAQDIIDALSLPFTLGMEEAYVSVSIGIALYPNDTSKIDTLIKYADQAMYLAKDNGRNQFSFFTHSMQVAAQYRHQLVIDLHFALKEQQFELYYQPIIDFQSGKIVKAEALLRWHHPAKGMISPVEFIPLAEESGLIIDIGNWVFQQAVKQLKSWQAQDIEIQLSINKSPIQFRSTTDYIDWVELLNTEGINDNTLVVEITESLLIDNTEAVKYQLLGFRDNGIQVAIDDFGTGYSTLSYLNKFDIDYLKIDRSFISNLSAEANELALCEAIIVMAHKLGLEVIAEGIETEQQKQLLVNAGCDFGQGFLFSKPVPVMEFEQLL
mgnify:FL=1